LTTELEVVPFEPGDFCADPPYDGFTQYAKGGFSWEDQERLLIDDKHDGPVVP
jgi:hypothetical protein